MAKGGWGRSAAGRAASLDLETAGAPRPANPSPRSANPTAPAKFAAGELVRAVLAKFEGVTDAVVMDVIDFSRRRSFASDFGERVS
jgi:hypothetical protein